VEISDYEIKKGDVSYSYETMSHFREQYPHDELFFIMGADSFINVEKWYKGEELLSEFGFIVSSRPGYPEKVLESCIKFYKEDYGTKIIRLRTKMPDISSTEIRETAMEGDSISHLVPPKVEQYINENDLYEDLRELERNYRWTTVL
jgi:nicotinate-nucleotide adenylyltransferase